MPVPAVNPDSTSLSCFTHHRLNNPCRLPPSGTPTPPTSRGSLMGLPFSWTCALTPAKARACYASRCLQHFRPAAFPRALVPWALVPWALAPWVSSRGLSPRGLSSRGLLSHGVSSRGLSSHGLSSRGVSRAFTHASGHVGTEDQDEERGSPASGPGIPAPEAVSFHSCYFSVL